MNLDDIKQILDLVREHELNEFELEQDGLKVRVRKGGPAQVVAAPAPAPAAAEPAPAPAAAPQAPAARAAALAETDAESANLTFIKSPIVGTYYQAPAPDAPPFVKVGDKVKKGQVLCIIEAMKLMNDIESDCDGEVAAIYVENGKSVQFGEKLFAIKVS
jgi:acetyl-CoA carboxylase biotin carboxyl carrier protein